MDCPPLKKLQSWLDDRYDLDDAELEHVQSCVHCLQFLDQTSQFLGLDVPSLPSANDSFHEEAEFHALQGRLRELSKETLEEFDPDDDQEFQDSDLNNVKEQVGPTNSASVDLKSLQASLPDQRYALIRVLGRGGSGLVVLAFDTKLNREVAIKFLVHDSELNKQRLSREGRILAELDHPNVVRVLDMGEFANSLESRKSLYLVMEYVAGGSAVAFPWRAETNYRELAVMLIGVAQGLQLAHTQGLVHRDIKPGNLLIDSEKRVLKVADFGLAKHVGESSTQVTQAGNLVGTPEYMSPEQIVGTLGDADATENRGETPSTDIYSLGATLYALLTEQPPFSGNPLAILRQIPEVQPVAPSILNPDVPRSLELICLHAMEKIPSRRYASMQEFAQDLQRFVDGRPVHARTPSLWQLGVDWCSSNRALASTLILLFCSLLGGVVGTTWMWLQASNNAKESASFASSLQDNRRRLRDSVSRFQQRIFAEEAMHWQMTEEFRREMFTDVIKYLDEFSELLNESNIELSELEQLAGDYLMISKAAREVGRYEDAMLAADRALKLVDQHRAGRNEHSASNWLHLEFRAASAACRARIPLQSFLDIGGQTSSKQANRSATNAAAVDAGRFASRCQSLVQQAQQQSGMAKAIDVSAATEDQFRWEIAKRDCVLLSLAVEGEPSRETIHEAIATYEQCLHELQRGKPVIPSERRLILGELGCELAWHVTSRPLYEAVTHGCLAGRQQEACVVYVDRILRGTGSDGFYSTDKLWAIGADLAAVAAFFDEPWSQVSPNLSEAAQAWLLNAAAYYLRALGRLVETLAPIRTSLEMFAQNKAWRQAAITTNNLSELEVSLGRLQDGLANASLAIAYADQIGDVFLRIHMRTTAADAMHQSGNCGEAGPLFSEAEKMQKERNSTFDLLYSIRGFRYCEFLLAPAERAASQVILCGSNVALRQIPLKSEASINGSYGMDQESNTAAVLVEVAQRVIKTIEWNSKYGLLLDFALDHLTLARVALIQAISPNTLPQPTLDLPHVADAVTGLRDSGNIDELPRGLLTAALYHFVRGEYALAEKNLAEAQQIAERGPMPLYLADIHLTRARFVGSLKGEARSLKGEVGSVKEDGVWRNVDPKDELAKAAKLIRELGYGRRFEELADAEEAAKNW